MPTTRERKPDPNAIYIASESISIGHDIINVGDRRRGSDRLVRAHFEYWRPDGTPIQRVPAPDPPIRPRRPRGEYDATCYAAVQPRDVRLTRKPLRVRRAADDSIVQLPVGSAFDRDAELVRLCPEAFVDPKSAVKR